MLNLPAPPKIATAYPPNLPANKMTGSVDILLLEDLTQAGFPVPASYYLSDVHQVQAVLRWLARFHAAYWGYIGDEDDALMVPPPLEVKQNRTKCGIWANGGYWYLATRSSENEDMIASGEYPWLTQRWVEEVAGKLAQRGGGVIGQTVLHGDCKGANILFSKPQQKGTSGSEQVEAALYDFQYVGLGFGVVDLAYFLGTTVSAKLLDSGGGMALLDYYYEQLMLGRSTSGELGDLYSKTVFSIQFDWAVVDWFRFMAGWGTWGSGARWIERRAEQAVAKWERAGCVEDVK